eukprot:COSAG02_NODE_19988_length_854_cov_0.488742_2_plen_88_part_00
MRSSLGGAASARDADPATPCKRCDDIEGLECSGETVAPSVSDPLVNFCTGDQLVITALLLHMLDCRLAISWLPSPVETHGTILLDSA